MNVNYYYDFSGTLTNDTEGNLVQLCREHAQKAREDGLEIQFADSGDCESICEYENCEKCNDPAHKVSTL